MNTNIYKELDEQINFREGKSVERRDVEGRSGREIKEVPNKLKKTTTHKAENTNYLTLVIENAETKGAGSHRQSTFILWRVQKS